MKYTRASRRSSEHSSEAAETTLLCQVPHGSTPDPTSDREQTSPCDPPISQTQHTWWLQSAADRSSIRTTEQDAKGSMTAPKSAVLNPINEATAVNPQRIQPRRARYSLVTGIKSTYQCCSPDSRACFPLPGLDHKDRLRTVPETYRGGPSSVPSQVDVKPSLIKVLVKSTTSTTR